MSSITNPAAPITLFDLNKSSTVFLVTVSLSRFLSEYSRQYYTIEHPNLKSATVSDYQETGNHSSSVTFRLCFKSDMEIDQVESEVDVYIDDEQEEIESVSKW